MPKSYSIAEARNDLPSILHDVERGGSVTITRCGKPVARREMRSREAIKCIRHVIERWMRQSAIWS